MKNETPDRRGLGWSGYASILRQLQIEPATAKQIVDRHSVHENTAREVLRCLHAMRLVHIANWVRRAAPANGYAAAWAFGVGNDARHPNPAYRRASTPSKHMRSTVITMAYVIRALTRPTSKADLGEISGVDQTTLRRFLAHGEDIGFVRVAKWAQGSAGGYPAALWALGSDPSEPRPQPISRPEIHRRYRALRKSAAALNLIHTAVTGQLHAAASQMPFIGGIE